MIAPSEKWADFDRLPLSSIGSLDQQSVEFSLKPFENRRSGNPVPALCSIDLPELADSQATWAKRLARPSRALNWDGDAELSSETLDGFDFSAVGRTFREKFVAPRRLPVYRIWREGQVMTT